MGKAFSNFLKKYENLKTKVDNLPTNNSTYYSTTSTPFSLPSLSDGTGATGSAIAGLYNIGKDYNTNFSSIIENQLAGAKAALNAANAGTNAIDLSGIIEDYRRNNQSTINTLNKALADNINTLRTSSEQSRNDLLTSLKRFQESNAESMKMQQQDYDAARAALEDETFMNQRNSIASTASRGLGGSGLQQLAQLQNRLAAGKNVSTLSQKNQTIQDSLRKALANQEQDTNTQLANLTANLENAIIKEQNQTAAKVNEANTSTTNLINNLIYNEQVRQAEARERAANAAANLNAQRAALQNQYSSGVNALKGLEKNLEFNLKNSSSKSDAKAALNKALNNLFTNDFGLDSSYTDLANERLNNLYNLYSKYYK